jgi:hypothetical protein
MARQIDLSTKVSAAGNHVTAELNDELVILQIDQGEYYGLNAVGANIWEQIQEPRTVAEIRDRLVSQYPDVDPERCAEDAIELIQELVEAGLAVVVPPGD